MKNIVVALFLFSGFGHLYAQHTVTLKSGEKKEGYVIQIVDGKLKLDANGNFETIDVNDVHMVNFGSGESAEGNDVTEQEIMSADGNYKIIYRMKGRKITRPPRMALGTKDKGVVVVNVTIDKYGNVKYAKAGADGTTTDSDYLITKAKQFAQEIRFDRDSTAPLETRGSVTFTF